MSTYYVSNNEMSSAVATNLREKKLKLRRYITSAREAADSCAILNNFIALNFTQRSSKNVFLPCHRGKRIRMLTIFCILKSRYICGLVWSTDSILGRWFGKHWRASSSNLFGFNNISLNWWFHQFKEMYSGWQQSQVILL